MMNIAPPLAVVLIILPQITQIPQIRNAAGCIISQRKTVSLVIVVLGFVCDNQRDLRETLGSVLRRDIREDSEKLHKEEKECEKGVLNYSN